MKKYAPHIVGGFLLTYLATKVCDWAWAKLPEATVASLSSFWHAVQFPVWLAMTYAAVVAVWCFVRDYRALRIRVAAINDWLYKKNDTGFNVAFARRRAGQRMTDDGMPSLRELIGVIAEWESNGRRFPDEPKP